MKGKTNDEIDTSIIKCGSGNSLFLMVNRWELGNCSHMEEQKLRYLYIDYSGTEKKYNEVNSKAGLTQEMKNMLCTLPESINKFENLKVLCICSFTDNYVISRGKICLRKLPDSIGNLINLRILDLSSNNLCDLPDSIGNLKNLEELYLFENHNLSKLPDSIGNLENLKILDLQGTNLNTLPESMENLTNLENLSLSKSDITVGPHSYGCNRFNERIYKIEDYPSDWYRRIVARWYKELPDWHFRDENEWRRVSNIDLSKKNLCQIPFGIHLITGLKELDVSDNQLTKIPYLLEKLRCLEKLYIHNNPNLNHLPDFLWNMWNLKELKIDGKLIKDLPKNAQFSLDKKSLEDIIVDLTLTSRNGIGMSDQDLSSMTGPYIVYLKKY